MSFLDASAILDLWDDARGLDSVSRSVALSAAATPTMERVAVAELPLGRRNVRLLQLRSTWDRTAHEATTQCPHCRAVLEFTIDPSTLLGAAEPGEIIPVRAEDRSIEWRPVTSNDLMEAAAESDVTGAERVIIDGCLVDRLAEDSLSDAERSMLAAAIAAADPLAEVLIHLDCADCGGTVTADLQIGDIVWGEIDRMARGILADVDALARAYGWTEHECLSLSPMRRAAYLEMIDGALV